MRVFLDSNILFSAALGSEPFVLLWEIALAGKIQLLTTAYCFTEAVDNLTHKRPAALQRYAELREAVSEVRDDQAKLAWARKLVPDQDAPVLAAAVAAGAYVLVTGDLRHFGPLMERRALPIRVRTLRAFLIEGARK